MKKLLIALMLMVCVITTAADRIQVEIVPRSRGMAGVYIPGSMSKEEAAQKQRAEKERAYAIAAAEVERQETAANLEQRRLDAPFVTNRIVLHRLRLATNGNDTYQLMVSSNYLKGTEGFPKDTNLAAYWYDQYQKNTNKVVRSK
jgi:hypothetical protein